MKQKDNGMRKQGILARKGIKWYILGMDMEVKAKTEVEFDRSHKKKELGDQGLNL